MKFEDEITSVKGIGEKTQKGLAKLEIFTVQDLIEHYPRDYDVYGDIRAIQSLREEETSVIEVSVVALPQKKKVRNLTIVQCRAGDATGTILLTWFNMPFVMKQLKMGSRYLLRGKAVRKNGLLQMEQPVFLTKENYHNNRYVMQPIYGLTFGITNHVIKKAVVQAIKNIEFPKDYLPVKLRKECNLIEYKSAVSKIHFPKNTQEMLEARRRIVFDEFFLFNLALNYLKKQKGMKKSVFHMKPAKECENMIERLPYDLTNAQRKVWKAIEQDLCSSQQMNRLVQGDVGSGKTVVAALALLQAAMNGYQGCLMVPTEVLAKQHLESLEEMLSPYGIQVGLLAGSMTAKEKRLMYEKIKNQEVHIVVGTHALIQEKAEYANLGLVVTDEQHRFGVKQREALSNKGKEPHILVMSATPIPRTLALILYGDLDVSTIDELPANRLPIKNCVVNTSYRPKAYEFIAKEIASGRQAYVICPMVEESENMEAENVIDYTEKLAHELPPAYVVAYLHGKMKAKEKNEIMERFANGDIHVLVSTTVIEVGVNVPNATVMMIENAERFGLAQLHQLRGRVGRGVCQSYCIFINGSNSKESQKRLEVLNHSNDGFHIANEDLKLRGPGDMFGIRQSGMLEFKLADIYKDAEILMLANEVAKRFEDAQVKLMLKKYEALRKKMELYTNEIFL
ncbi:ATP-dependent DNA helicase RecG [[Clostridium] polysaccharolyticum]|uniref:ATP-dependent DNA helicase RecG n=1 Tax=[Clostridium] polysaccharolyticum TaxID=29364 RepID=A0A1I0B191_9FIRM|nr:ATP-dependent DNA helicase RecG [[Clostridium] polysaccharolyticum]SET00446.1 ATP-dependent DNA helicase RecG [[Clostridium] polysaccharolyticum]